MFGEDRNNYVDRQFRKLIGEKEELQARLDVQDANVWNLQQEIIALNAKAGQPANLTEVAVTLRALVPSLPQAPGYGQLRGAKTPKEFAQAIHLLLLHAQRVGASQAVQTGAQQ